MRRILIFILSLSVGACASWSSSKINNLNISIQELQKIVIESLPLGKRAQSQNSREFFSEYFVVESKEYVEAFRAPVRKYAHIYILGDRRPYKIEVQVVTEAKNSSGEYNLVKYDEGLARVISRRIQNTLHKRRDDLNIIDDFRVF